jgi:hypothetical protein
VGDRLVGVSNPEDGLLLAAVHVPEHPFSGAITGVKVTEIDPVGPRIEEVRWTGLDPFELPDRAAVEEVFRPLPGAAEPALVVDR